MSEDAPRCGRTGRGGSPLQRAPVSGYWRRQPLAYGNRFPPRELARYLCGRRRIRCRTCVCARAEGRELSLPSRIERYFPALRLSAWIMDSLPPNFSSARGYCGTSVKFSWWSCKCLILPMNSFSAAGVGGLQFFMFQVFLFPKTAFPWRVAS